MSSLASSAAAKQSERSPAKPIVWIESSTVANSGDFGDLTGSEGAAAVAQESFVQVVENLRGFTIEDKYTNDQLAAFKQAAVEQLDTLDQEAQYSYNQREAKTVSALVDSLNKTEGQGLKDLVSEAIAVISSAPA